jgi:hypothetical protein
MVKIAHQCLVLRPAYDAFVDNLPFHPQPLRQQVAQGDCAGNRVGVGIVVRQDQNTVCTTYGFEQKIMLPLYRRARAL